MCRKDQLRGLALLGFGLGLLASVWIDSHFWQVCFGILALGAGVLVLAKK